VKVGQLGDLGRIVDGGLVAIVRLDQEAPLQAVVEALCLGGIDVIEVTMTTPGALDALKDASASLGNRVLLGAGTVLDSETARAAILAGARFIVSPTLSTDVTKLCHRYGVVSIPGAYTPTEILAAWELGADLVKVFPAGSLGPQYIRDVLAPLPQIRLVPTGGVNLTNIRAFVEAGATAVAVGGNLVSKSVIARGDYETLTQTARQFRVAVDTARNPQAEPAIPVVPTLRSTPPGKERP
jgi:2-dehydro-3-deoxyphosphogluconate aldolase/(4S)-4-hydroxy-2-oxoglutarate aldolase